MKKIHLLLLLLFCCTILYSQESTPKSFLDANLDITTDSDKSEIFNLWNNYLSSMPDSLYDNPYWNQAEKAKYKSYDLLKSEGFLTPGLYGFDWLKNVVISIISHGDYYVIRSIFYWDDTAHINLMAIANVVAKKENGAYKLYNWLPFYTRNWFERQVGLIRYKYHPQHPFNISKAEKANELIQFLTDKFDIKVDNIEYYIAPNCLEIMRLKGFDHVAGDGNNLNNLCGFYDRFNNIIYSNSVKGENYEHEIVHLINNFFPDAHGLFLNGLSDYFIEDNIKTGLSITEHFRRMDDYLTKHPEINLNEFDTFYELDGITSPSYFLGLMLCHLCMKKGGIDLLKEALSFGAEDDDLYRFIEQKLNIARNDINKISRKIIHQFAKDGFVPYKL
ncbi:MAG: hypothetical protein LBK94_03185 [Prevotellaceae bacterium]|jgi:hypothetical protein|nr:hypothetical protein [Prevotellaceae bacterium]